MFVVGMLLTQDVSEGLHTLAVATAGPVALFLCTPSLTLLMCQLFLGSDSSEERIEKELQMCAKRQ